MINLVKPLAITLGGATLMGGSFVTFAALSGVPLSKVAGIGVFFPTPQGTEQLADPDSPMMEEVVAADTRSPVQVIESARGPLHAFVLPSPFSASELEDLERRLQNRMRELDLRDADLDRRQAELEETAEHYEELFAELADLQTSLLSMEEERLAQEEELVRDQAALAEREAQAYRVLAPMYAGGGKVKDLAKMLSDVYEAEDAAKILMALTSERAGELLGEIYKLDRDKGAAFQEAYRVHQRGD